jgi:zinc transport system ATP-binding protein
LTTRSGSTVLELRHASIGYDGRPVVEEANLTVNRGEVIALVGANGSGKTTLIRGVLGLAPILSGTIDVFGAHLATLHDRWRVGYVPQRDNLVSGLPTTVYELVASGRLARTRPWQRFGAADREQIRAAIETVGLASRMRDPVDTLSGGQQRRALVARALAADAELLLLDEPTAGVDAQNQQLLADTMAELARRGTTIVLVTHELGPAAAVVARVVVMRSGRIAYDGPTATAPHFDAGLDHHHIARESRRPGPIGLTG